LKLRNVGLHTVVDVGGGQGKLLVAILSMYPHLHGIVFDQPSVIEEARKAIEAAGLAARCITAAGDFFEVVPDGADTYLLKSVLHDWDDENCIKILKNCRKAMRSDGRILVVDAVISNEKSGGTFAKLLDLQMLVEQRGRERTAAEFQALFAAADLSLKRVILLPTLQDIVEAVPV
jgi:hypothetical protein